MAKFISTQSIVLELPLIIDHLPATGTEVQASVIEGAVVAGGFYVVAAVARQGVAACVASTLGTGPNSVQARHSLGREGVAVLTRGVVGDIGLRIATIDGQGMRSSMLSPGVEAEPNLHDLENLSWTDNDYLLVNLNDLAAPTAAQTWSSWLEDIPQNVKLVVAGGPLIDEVDPEILVRVLQRANVLTLNEFQARTTAERLGGGPQEQALRMHLPQSALLVMREGKRGAVIQVDAQAPLVRIPAFEMPAKDTTGVGDAHTGVLVACLMQGMSPADATLRANAAAALVLRHRGYYKVLTAAQIDQFLAERRSQ